MIRILPALLGLLIACCYTEAALAFTPEPGRYAPALSAPDLVSGKVVALADYRGQWVMLEFWASWCDSCQEQMSDIEALAAAAASDPAACRVMSVAVDDADTLNDLKAMIATQQISWPVLHELKDEIASDFGWEIIYLPTTVLIDPEGQIVFVESGIGELQEIVRFFTGQPALGGAYQLKLDATAQPDGSLKVAISARSPQRLPLSLSFSALREFEEEEPAPEPEPAALTANNVPAPDAAAGTGEHAAAVQETASALLPVESDELSQSIQLDFELTQQDFAEVIIPAAFLRGTYWLTYEVSYTIPGSETFAAGEGIQLVQEGEFDPEEIVFEPAAEAPAETSEP